MLKRHAAYLEFLGGWLGKTQLLPWWGRSIEIRGTCLYVAGLDSAWMACGGENRGRLLLGRYQINQTVLHQDADDADWRLALLHHPWDYFAEFDGHETRPTIHQHCDLLLRGHLHFPQSERVVPPDPTRACLELAAGCVYENSQYPNAFQWIELHSRPRRIKVLYRTWIQGAWTIDRNQPGCPEGDATFDLPLSGAVRAVAVHSRPAISKVPPRVRTLRRNTRASRDRQTEEMHQKPTFNQGDIPPGLATPSAAGKPSVQNNHDDDRCDVLLLYVNDKERTALVETFTGSDRKPPRLRTIHDLPCFDLGEVGSRRIFATATNVGSATPGGSATLTVDAITKLNPQWIIAVGVAFSMDPNKASIGTILVSDRVSCYEPQRVGRKLIRRGVSVAVQPYLKQHFEMVSSQPYWKDAPVCFGEILSGEKLIDDPVFKGKLKRAYPEAIGGEMEAAGIYSAALLKRCDWIVVKGVCDYADGNKGEDKDNRQALAAKNAAEFVRHVLTAYDHPASIEEPGPALATSIQKSERKRAAGTVHRDAVAAITKSLDLIPELCTALASQPGVSATKPTELAEWLCALNNDISDVFQTFRNALSHASEELRGKHESILRLAQHARDIFGWMAVMTVLEGYEQENALAGRWKKGAIFRIPLGRGPCVEVLVARWRGGKAEFGIEPSRFDYGKDDITPKNLGEIGFGKDLRPDPDRAVDYVLRKAYQEIFRETVPGKLPENKVRALKVWLDIQLRDKRRRLRLVIDQSDLHNELNCESYAEAISTALPQLHLIFINSDAPEEDVFVVSASQLAAEIYACLPTIEAAHDSQPPCR